MCLDARGELVFGRVKFQLTSFSCHQRIAEVNLNSSNDDLPLVFDERLAPTPPEPYGCTCYVECVEPSWERSIARGKELTSIESKSLDNQSKRAKGLRWRDLKALHESFFLREATKEDEFLTSDAHDSDYEGYFAMFGDEEE